MNVTKSHFRNALGVVLYLFVGMSTVWGQASNAVDAQGKKHGTWVKYYEGGKVMRYQGQFQHGVPVGFWLYLHANGQKMAEMKYRGATGVCSATEYAEDGKKMAIGLYSAPNQKDSTWTYYRPEGTLLSREHYAKGAPVGTWNSYHPNGKVADEYRYANGVKQGNFASYTEEGKVRMRGTYTNGTLDGWLESFDVNGKLKFKGKYAKGLKIDVWMYFEDGRTVRMETYKGGRLIKTENR